MGGEKMHGATMLQDGKLQGPPMLEEGTIDLEKKKSFWPFSDSSDFGGPLQRGDG